MRNHVARVQIGDDHHSAEIALLQETRGVDRGFMHVAKCAGHAAGPCTRFAERNQPRRRYLLMRTLGAIAIAAAIAGAVPAHADTDVNKKCNTMTLKAHPTTLPNIPAVVNLRKSYFDLCVARRGVMDQELAQPR